jgi:hypothetical protein
MRGMFAGAVQTNLPLKSSFNGFVIRTQVLDKAFALRSLHGTFNRVLFTCTYLEPCRFKIRLACDLQPTGLTLRFDASPNKIIPEETSPFLYIGFLMGSMLFDVLTRWKKNHQ